MVFVDHENNRLLIHDENGLFDFERHVSQRPVDVTCINEYNVAVTHNEKPYRIEIVNIANKNIVKRIKTSERCYGITNKSGKLIYYESGRGIQTVDITNGRAATTVVKVYDNHDWTYVTTSKDKIYLTDQYSSTVTCYTLTGQKVWECKNETFVISVRGVTIDNEYNVYVVSYGNDSIVEFHQMESTSVNC